jgi:hypothetical protein
MHTKNEKKEEKEETNRPPLQKTAGVLRTTTRRSPPRSRRRRRRHLPRVIYFVFFFFFSSFLLLLMRIHLFCLPRENTQIKAKTKKSKTKEGNKNNKNFSFKKRSSLLQRAQHTHTRILKKTTTRKTIYAFVERYNNNNNNNNNVWNRNDGPGVFRRTKRARLVGEHFVADENSKSRTVRLGGDLLSNHGRRASKHRSDAQGFLPSQSRARVRAKL